MKRSKFSLSQYKLLTCKMGKLIPVTWELVNQVLRKRMKGKVS